MKWNLPVFDELDIIYQSDETVPEGREEISEKDFDRILQESEEENDR